MSDRSKPNEPHRSPVEAGLREPGPEFSPPLEVGIRGTRTSALCTGDCHRAPWEGAHNPLTAAFPHRQSAWTSSGILRGGVAEKEVRPAEAGNRSAEANCRFGLDRAARALPCAYGRPSRALLCAYGRPSRALLCAFAHCARALPCAPARGVPLSPDQLPRRAPVPRCSRFITCSVLPPWKAHSEVCRPSNRVVRTRP